MKTLLNVVGILALIAGPVIALADENLTMVLIGLPAGALFLGLGKIVALLETHLERTSTQRLLERDYWKLMASNLNSAPTVPPAPAEARYYVRIGEESKGPLDEKQVRAMRARDLLSDDSYVAREGTQEWKRYREVFTG